MANPFQVGQKVRIVLNPSITEPMIQHCYEDGVEGVVINTLPKECKVNCPTRYPDDPSFWQWVNIQELQLIEGSTEPVYDPSLVPNPEYRTHEAFTEGKTEGTKAPNEGKPEAQTTQSADYQHDQTSKRGESEDGRGGPPHPTPAGLFIPILLIPSSKGITVKQVMSMFGDMGIRGEVHFDKESGPKS